MTKAEEVIMPPGTAVVKAWLLTLPGHHPLWQHYCLSVISLADIPGVPPAVKQFPEATHEILLMAMNPECDPAPDAPEEFQYLSPVNYVKQIDVVSDEIAILAGAAVVVRLLLGHLWAEFQGVHGMRELYDHAVQIGIKGS